MDSVVKYLELKHPSQTAIHEDEDMVWTLGYDASSFSTVKKWASELKRGSASLEDDPRSGRPSTVTIQETVDCVLT